MKKPVVLCILDGVGIAQQSDSNAYYLANTPNLDSIKSEFPGTTLKCSGLDVGLPAGQMGNSEVGHLNLGAGRVVYQSLTLINKAISDKTFFKNESFLKAIENAKKNNSKLHLMGLLGDGGVHSEGEHLKALLELAHKNGLTEVYVHAFMDGRDTLRDSGLGFLTDLIQFMNDLGCGELASISGRYYAMDRDNRFERNYKAYNAMVLHETMSFDNPIKYVQDSYDNEVYDEFIEPSYNNKVDGKIEDNDSVIFTNFRPDRATQIASILTNSEYVEVFEKQPKNLTFVCMMRYDNSVIGDIAFSNKKLDNVLGVYLANLGYKQLRIAETEKYAHVTFFFDGQVKYDGVNAPELEGCKRVLINSPKVATYDLQPEMSAYGVKDALLKELENNVLDVVVLNFANGDMVGHTGDISAAIKAMEAVDDCVGQVFKRVQELGGVMLITADHGNCEQMKDETGNVLTAHSLNDVELIVTKKGLKLSPGSLSDIAPTMLELLNVDQPEEMSGGSLIK